MWYLVEKRKEIGMFNVRILDSDISQNARAKTLEKRLLTNIAKTNLSNREVPWLSIY